MKNQNRLARVSIAFHSKPWYFATEVLTPEIVGELLGEYLLFCTPSGTVIADRGPDHIIRSTDRGQSWIPIGLGSQGLSLGTLAADLHGAIDGFWCNDDRAELYRSTNDGLSWDNIASINSIIENYAINSENIFFAATGYTDRRGVLRSQDEGLTWRSCNEGLNTSLWIRSLVITPAGFLFAGTEKGIYRSAKSTENHEKGKSSSFDIVPTP